MQTLWFAIAALVIATYVVLDGFDFGAGALHLFVARRDPERRQVLAAIGPFWDGNEVWLLVAGGVLFVAFPKVLASGLSGFYFAIMLVLWVLILRGISIEFRSHLDDPMWRELASQNRRGFGVFATVNETDGAEAVWRIDPRSGTSRDAGGLTVGDDPIGVAYDGASVWVAAAGSDRILRFVP